jgi:hypothetical protein
MKDKIMFQNRPTELANSTWYFIGMNQKLMVDAIGQIFQFACRVSQIFYFQTCTPLPNDLMSLSMITWLIGKNPVIKTGANTSWSKSILPKTWIVLLWDLIKVLPKEGSNLEYQKWRQVPIYPNPMRKKSIFLLTLNSFFSKTG